MLDVLLVLGAVWLVVLCVALRRLFRRVRRGACSGGRGRSCCRRRVLYLAFLVLWGLNYRRLPLEDKLPFDAAAVTPDGARSLADAAVARINALYDAAHAARVGR